jgi:hypothetical protein
MDGAHERARGRARADGRAGGHGRRALRGGRICADAARRATSTASTRGSWRRDLGEHPGKLDAGHVDAGLVGARWGSWCLSRLAASDARLAVRAGPRGEHPGNLGRGPRGARYGPPARPGGPDAALIDAGLVVRATGLLAGPGGPDTGPHRRGPRGGHPGDLDAGLVNAGLVVSAGPRCEHPGWPRWTRAAWQAGHVGRGPRGERPGWTRRTRRRGPRGARVDVVSVQAGHVGHGPRGERWGLVVSVQAGRTRATVGRSPRCERWAWSCGGTS